MMRADLKTDCPQSKKKTASTQRDVVLDLPDDLPISETELQIVETYLFAIIKDLAQKAQDPVELERVEL